MLMGVCILEDKLIIFSSKSKNMRTVIQRLVYGANITRSEQRGLLSAEEGDTILLYDIDKRILMGPFRAASPILYSTDSLWGEGKWPFRIRLEPYQAKIGVLRGRPLLDLLLEAGRLSLREPSALETYWIHPLILDEARALFEGFLDRAYYLSRKRLLYEHYSVKESLDIWEPPNDSLRFEDVICDYVTKEYDRKRQDWIIEALIPKSQTTRSRLSPPARQVRSVTGLYLYYRRYLDVAFYTSSGYVSIIEVKKYSKLEEGLDQLLYYTYALSMGFRIRKERIIPILAVHGKRGRASQGTAERVRKIINKLSEHYGLPSDRITVVSVDPICERGNPDMRIEIIW